MVALTVTGSSQAQVLSFETVIHTDRLSQEEKQYLEGLDQVLTRLFTDYSWTDSKYRYKLPVQIELYFEKGSRGITHHRYSAGIMAALRSGVRLRDRKWDFRYSRDAMMHIGDPYDPFTGLIEFYTWICLGLEADRYSLLGGQPYFDRARLVSENARFEIEFSAGWDQRRDFIRSLQNDTYQNIRTAAYHAEAGLYYLEKGDEETARSHLIRVSELLLSGSPELVELHRDDHIIRFIDVDKYVEALKEIDETKILERLSKWDYDHKELYD